jgi:hypothetical protein
VTVAKVMAQLYDVGTRAWQPDPTEGWVSSELQKKLVDGDKVKLIFQLENGEVGTHFQIAVYVRTKSDTCI